MNVGGLGPCLPPSLQLSQGGGQVSLDFHCRKSGAAAANISVSAQTFQARSVTNSKHWFTTSFLGGRRRKAMLGVWVSD